MPDVQGFDPDKYIAEKAQATVQANTFDPDKYLAEKSQGQGGILHDLQPWYTGGRAALNTVTLGLANPAIGAINADVDTVKDAITGKGDLSMDAWKKNYQADIDRWRQAKEEHPIANVAGSVAGAFNPAGPAAALAKGVKGLVGAGAETVGSYVPRAIANSYLGNLAGRVATGGVEGAATAVGMEAPRQVAEGSTGYEKKGDKDVPDLNSVGKVGALIGGGIPVAGEALSALGTGAKKLGTKLAASFFGPSENHIKYYLENPEAVNAAPSMGALKDKLDGVVGTMRDEVEQGKLSVSEAQANIKDLKQAVNAHRAQSDMDFKLTAKDINDAFKEAKNKLAEAYESKVNELKGVKAPTELADEATQAVKDLKGKIVEGSQEATSKINPESEIETYSPYQVLKSAQARLSIAGQGPVTPQAKAASDQIQNLMNTFGSLPGKLSGNDAKALIQQIDRSEQAVYNSGEFTDDVSNAFKQLRSNLDQQLKGANPEYTEAMKPVAENTGLHGEVAGKFGDRGKAISSLNRIASPTSQVERENLIKLGQATGRDFETPVNKYMEAQGLLKDPERLEQMRQSLPEYQQMLAAEKDAGLLAQPDTKAKYIEGRLQDSGLLKQQEQAEGLLAQRQEGLVGSQDRLAPYKGFTPDTTQGKLETAARGLDTDKEKIELIKKLKDLSQLSDTDFVKAIKDRSTKLAFEGQDVNGSRKVNLFGALGGLFGGFMSHSLLGTELGVGLGAGLGAMADKYGPKMTKAMLDGALKIQGSPTLAKIQALQVPPAVKAALAKELADFNQPEKSK